MSQTLGTNPGASRKTDWEINGVWNAHRRKPPHARSHYITITIYHYIITIITGHVHQKWRTSQDLPCPPADWCNWRTLQTSCGIELANTKATTAQSPHTFFAAPSNRIKSVVQEIAFLGRQHEATHWTTLQNCFPFHETKHFLNLFEYCNFSLEREKTTCC